MRSKILSNIYYNEDILMHHYKTYEMFQRDIVMKGGAFSINYHDTNIKFNKIVDNNELHLYLSNIDENDNCIYIIIDIPEHIAYIQGVTNNMASSCFDNPELNNGKAIMEITIKMLEKYKEKLSLKKIELKDNSFLTCDKKTKIILSDLSLLQYNETFYSRFGFRPKEEEQYEYYMKNKAILSIIKVNKINLLKILNKWGFKIDQKLKDSMMEHYNEHLDYNIVQWFNLFSRLFMKKDCALFKHIIESLYIKLGLRHLNGISYVKKLK